MDRSFLQIDTNKAGGKSFESSNCAWRMHEKNRSTAPLSYRYCRIHSPRRRCRYRPRDYLLQNVYRRLCHQIHCSCASRMALCFSASSSCFSESEAWLCLSSSRRTTSSRRFDRPQQRPHSLLQSINQSHTKNFRSWILCVSVSVSVCLSSVFMLYEKCPRTFFSNKVERKERNASNDVPSDPS